VGWAGGSGVLRDVWSEVREFVPAKQRVDVLARLMAVFAAYDCDTLDEVISAKWPESEPAYDRYRETR
jgi:hypothetical protein